MKQQIREIRTEPGQNYDYFNQYILPTIPRESSSKQQYFDQLQSRIQFVVSELETIRIEGQIFLGGSLKRQIWQIQFTTDDFETEYQGKKIEGLLVLPNEFPKKFPQFYLGRFNDNLKFWHEHAFAGICSIYADGQLCSNWQTSDQSNIDLVNYLLAMQSIFFNPCEEKAVDKIFVSQPNIEKGRRRRFQASLLLDWEQY